MEQFRMCVSCRARKNKRELIRVYKAGDDIKVDENQKGGGRGAYVCKCKACLEAEKKRRNFNRIFSIWVGSHIYAKIYDILVKEDENFRQESGSSEVRK
jgi:predicted RNA-binding protein YlxR (DUF448 family)